MTKSRRRYVHLCGTRMDIATFLLLLRRDVNTRTSRDAFVVAGKCDDYAVPSSKARRDYERFMAAKAPMPAYVESMCVAMIAASS